jgi:hypothetical protein
MVSVKPLTQYFRLSIPLLGIIALIALFLKLPEASNFFALYKCRSCIYNEPYLPLIGCGYFGFLIAASLLFPAFPNRYLALGGLIWALLLSFVLTYINLPDLCLACLVGHTCNILIWSIWFFVPAPKHKSKATDPEVRLCILLFVPVSVIALFSSLNLTFMVYNIKPESNTGLHAGDSVPLFTAQTIDGRKIDNTNTEEMVLNFITPDCAYCKEQLQILHKVKSQLPSISHRIINISPVLLPELIQYYPMSEWVEDKEGALRKQFKIQGFPTMYILGSDGKIIRVIQGVPEGLQEDLENNLVIKSPF